MHYSISKGKSQNFLSISLKFEAVDTTMTLKLPLWRPGRYQVQNFAKNIRTITSNIGDISFVGRNEWLLSNLNKGDKVEIKYDYFAQHKDAGGTWLSDDFALINFIGCGVVPIDYKDQKIKVSLNFDKSYRVASSGKREKENYVFSNFEELTETPFLIGKEIHHSSFEYEGVKFNIWFQGKISPDWPKILNDFLKYTKVQFEIFKSFPHKEYHYLCLIPTFKHYHGVEHYKNTVITLGPANSFHQQDFYNNLLGVSSHELFHVWNIKEIRPKELCPYNLFQEAYFDTGFVAEGITTYYGDACLYRAGVFDNKQYKKELNTLLTRHFENQGRFVKSVADSSLELWIDGYEKGIPARKTSIYIKGALTALILDALIQKETNKTKSLDNVLFQLYEKFGKTKIGYTSKDYQKIAENVIGRSLQDYFDDFIYGVQDLKEPLVEALTFLGWEVEKTNSLSKWMSDYGMKIDEKGKVIDIAYNFEGTVAIGDEFLFIDNQSVSSWEEVVVGKEKIELTLEREGQLIEKQLIPKKNMYYSKLSVT